MRFPVTLSVGMSRRLFTTSSAQASAPHPMPPATAVAVTRSSWTYAVPMVATRPKKTNTDSSPSAR